MSSELDKLRKEANASLGKLKVNTQSQLDTENHLVQVQQEYHRVAEISKAPTIIINDIDSQFKKATKLTSLDITFLFIATALQVARQYLITSFSERMSDKEAAKEVKGDKKEKSDRKHRYYQPSLEEVITNPVPFDAIDGSAKYGALKGYGSLGHRGATPGHDPILGFIFGTANIATSTLTNWKMESYHISTGIRNRDEFSNIAQTPLVFSYTFDKLLNQGFEGKAIIGSALAKEYIHLKSDINSKDSLPLPIISAISPQFAGDLATMGIDAANVIQVGKQALYSSLINTLVSIIHSLLYDESRDSSRNLYQVRTRKILSYSNILASASNVVVSACTNDLKKLDIGGLAVTLIRFIKDTKFISDVKEDFLKNELYDRIVGTEYDFIGG